MPMTMAAVGLGAAEEGPASAPSAIAAWPFGAGYPILLISVGEMGAQGQGWEDGEWAAEY